MIVYIDVLILENFIVNSFLLLLTSQTMGIKVKVRRLFFSAFLAALYTFSILFKPLNFLTLIPFKILVAALISFLTFGRKDLLFIIKSSLVFIVYTFVLAGIIYYIDYRNNGLPVSGVIELDTVAKKHMLTIMICYIFLNRIFTLIIDRFKLNSFTYNIEIITAKSTLKLKALLDTGNELREPITNLPVIIVERNKLKKINYEQYDKIYVPYKVVNGEKNILEAFKPEFVKIYKGSNMYENKNAIIAVCDNRLSEHSEYCALLSRGII